VCLCIHILEHLSADLIVSGFECFFPSIAARVAALYSLSIHSLRPEKSSVSISSSVDHALETLGQRYAGIIDGSSTGIMFAQPDRSIAAAGVPTQVHDLLLQVARADWHALADSIVSIEDAQIKLQLPREQRPRGRVIPHPASHTNFLIIHFSQLYTSLNLASNPQPRSAIGIDRTTTLPLFLQFAHQLFLHCSDFLDYAQHMDAIQTSFRTGSIPSSTSGSGWVSPAFTSSHIYRILRFALPLLTKALQQLGEGGDMCWCSVEIGNLVQSLLSLLCRIGSHHMRDIELAAPLAVAASSLPAVFRGLQLRSMLGVLLDSQQFTTTVFHSAAYPPSTSSSSINGSASGLPASSTRTGKLHNILVPFAQKVLSGIFFHFAVASRKRLLASSANKELSSIPLDTLTMSHDEFIRFYALCDVPVTLPSVMGATAAALTGSAPGPVPSLEPTVSARALAGPVSVTVTSPPQAVSSSATSPTGFVLPAAPILFQRAHTAAALTASSTVPANAPLSGSAGSITQSLIPSNTAEFQAHAEFCKALACTRTSSSACGINADDGQQQLTLAAFLKWNLHDFVDNARSKMQQLRHFYESHQWTDDVDQWNDVSTHSERRHPHARTEMGKLLQEIQTAYSTLLEHHVFPAPGSITHGSNQVAPTNRPLVVVESKPTPTRVSADDMAMLHPNPNPIQPLMSTAVPTATVANTVNPVGPKVASTAADEFIPRLMESESKWTNHSQHTMLLTFLDKFTQHSDVINKKAGSTAPAKQPAALSSKGKDSLSDSSWVALQSTPTQPISTTVGAMQLLGQPAPLHSEPLGISKSDESKDGMSDEKNSDAAAGKPQSVQRMADSLRLPIAPSPQPSPIVPTIQSTPTPSPVSAASSLPQQVSGFPGGELEEPARCLSSLFMRCLSEMGGGSAKKKVESWRDALRAEKAFAAACVKHNGLTAEVSRYSSSVAAVEFLRLALSVHPLTGLPRVRLLSHPTCPQWLKAVVQSTFQEVRSPILQLMRGIEEQEEMLNGSDASSAPAVIFTNGYITVKSSPHTSAGRKSLRTMRKLASQSRAMVGCVLANSLFLVRELEGIHKDIAVRFQQYRPYHGSINVQETPSTTTSKQLDESDESGNSSDDEELTDEVESHSIQSLPPDSQSQLASGCLTVPMRYRTMPSKNAPAGSVTESASTIRLPASSFNAPPLPSHLLHAAAFRNARSHRRKKNASTNDANAKSGSMHGSASSTRLPQKVTATPPAHSSLASGVIGPNAFERQQSEIIRRRRHSVLTVSPAVTDISITENDMDGIEDTSTATSSINSYLRGSGADTPAIQSAASSALWSTWTTSKGTTGARSAYESKWISKLVHIGVDLAPTVSTTTAGSDANYSTLRELLQPSIHRFQSVCLLRVKLLGWLNQCFTLGYTTPLVEHVFPILLSCLARYSPTHDAHLLHYGQLILRGHTTNHVLLHFYKHLVIAINQQLAPTKTTLSGSEPATPIRFGSDDTNDIPPVAYSDPAWLRIRCCLQLLNLNFLSEDTESLVGSGVFAALFRTIQHIDLSIQNAAGAVPAAPPIQMKPYSSDGRSPSTSPMPMPMIGTGIGGFGRMPSNPTDINNASSIASPNYVHQLAAFPAPLLQSAQSSPEPAVTSSSSSNSTGGTTSESVLPITLRCASAYHLKFQCWQSLKYLTLFVLTQQQRAAAAPNSSNSVLLSSVARQFVSMIIHQLSVMAAAPAKMPLQHEDGSLMYTMDCARILCQFTKLKSVCSISQLFQLLELSHAAPATVQTVLMQLVTTELHRLNPNDLDVTPPSTLSPLTGALPSSLSSYFVQQMLSRIGQRSVANSVVPTVCQLDPTTTIPAAASTQSRQTSSSAPSGILSPVFVGRHINPISSSNRVNEAASPVDWRRDPSSFLNLPSTGGVHSRENTLNPLRAISASPQPPASSDGARPPLWHESGYQSWRHYPHFHASGHQGETALVEELIVALRSLAGDRNWRMVVAAQLENQILQFPTVIDQLARSVDHTPNTLNTSSYAALASLAVLGGYSFQLRKGALVEVLLHGRRSVRGTVKQLDTHLCRVMVTLSPSQPHAIQRPYGRSGGAMRGIAAHSSDEEEFVPAALIEQEFSFDQVRVWPMLAAPLLSELPRASEIWSAVRRCLQAVADIPEQIKSTATTVPSLPTLLCMQLQKLLVHLLHAQFTTSLSKARQRALNPHQSDAQSIVNTFSAQGSPNMSPMAEPDSPVKGAGNDRFVLSNTYPSSMLSPIPSSPLHSSPEPLSAGDVSGGTKGVLAQMQSLTRASDDAGPGRPLVSSMHVTLENLPSPISSQSSSSSAISSLRISPDPESIIPFAVDYCSFLPLLLRLISATGYELMSLNLFELQHSSALFSRRLLEVLRTEHKHDKLWQTVNATQPAARTFPPTARQLMQQMSNDESLANRVSFVPFASIVTASGSPSYRQSLISALQTFFASHPSLSSSLAPRPMRLMIFPLFGSTLQDEPLPGEEEELSVGSEAGILVVQLPSLSKRDQSECKEQSDPVPRMLTLSDLGVSSELATSILPLGPMSAPDADEAEAEALEMVLGNQCDPRGWSAEQWARELSTLTSTTPPTVQVPSRGHLSVSSRRVIIGPNGQPAVLTTATPAVSRPASPTWPKKQQHHQTSALHHAGLNMADGRSVGSNTNAVSVPASPTDQPSVSASSGSLQAKYVRTTTQAERCTLLKHIATATSHQSTDPNQWRLYDFIDARDSYGDWYLAQIIGFKQVDAARSALDVRSVSAAPLKTAVLVHFFAWDDMYREWITLDTYHPPLPPPRMGLDGQPMFVPPLAGFYRLKNPTLFQPSLERLEADRFIRRVKVFGKEVVATMKAEREAAAIVLARDQARQLASIALSDVYSYPIESYAGNPSVTGDSRMVSDNLALGTQVLVTAGAIELLSIQLGRGVLAIATEYAKGDRLMVLDTVNKLCEAEVLDCRFASHERGGFGEILIHYIGWPSKWDEWIPVNSDRIQSKRGLGAASSAFKRKQSGSISEDTDAPANQLAYASWNGEGGHAAQLIGLVGEQAVIMKLAATPLKQTDAGVSSEEDPGFADLIQVVAPSSTGASDTLAQVQLLDPSFGSLICFWTRLHLLRRMDQVDIPHLSLPGLLRCNSMQIRAALFRSERTLIGHAVSQLVQHIVRAQTTAEGASVGNHTRSALAEIAAAHVAIGDLPLSPTVLLSEAVSLAPPSDQPNDLLSPPLGGSSLPSLPNMRAHGWGASNESGTLTWPVVAALTDTPDATSSNMVPSPDTVSNTSVAATTESNPANAPSSPPIPKFSSMFSRVLASLPRVSQLLLPLQVQCPAGLQQPTNSAHSVCDASVVVHPRHRTQLTMETMQEAERLAQRNHVFVTEEKEGEAKEGEKQPISNVGEPAITVAASVQLSPSSPRSALSSTGGPQVDPLQQQAWLSERMYRNLNHIEWDKLSVIGSLVALLLQQSSASLPKSVTADLSAIAPAPLSPQLTVERVEFLSQQCHQLGQALMAQLAPQHRRGSMKPYGMAEADTVNIPGSRALNSVEALSSVHVQTIRPGEVTRLSSSFPGTRILRVNWTRGSQPNFEVEFVSATEDISTEELDAHFGVSQLKPTASVMSSNPVTKSSLIALTHLKSVPVLRSGASPLLLPNPCYIISSRSSDVKKPVNVTTASSSARNNDEETEAADDDFSLLVTPYSTSQLETLVAMTELVLHLRREVRVSPNIVASADVLAALDQLLLRVWHIWSNFLSYFHSLCPWPCARFKGIAFELIAHITCELMVSLNASTIGGSDSIGHAPMSEFVRQILTTSFIWTVPFISEARDRYTTEKENWPLFSSYLHRMIEMLVALMQCEQTIKQVKERLFSGSAPSAQKQETSRERAQTNATLSSMLQVPKIVRPVSASPLLSPRSIFSDAYDESEIPGGDHNDEQHEWDDYEGDVIGLVQSPVPSPTPSEDGDRAHSHYPSTPSIYTTPPPGPSTTDESATSTPARLHSRRVSDVPTAEIVPVDSLIELVRTQIPVVLDVFELILNKRHLFQRNVVSSAGPIPKCVCNDCKLTRGENPSLDAALMLVDFHSSVWPQLLGGSVLMLPHAARYRLFDELINVTASPERWLPEFPFTTQKERALAKELAADNGSAITAAPVDSTDDESDTTWQQLCKALKVTPEAHLRGKLGDVTWKARFKGLHNRGAEGLPGPFRQSLTEICSDIRAAATNKVAGSILIQSPNFFYDTGLDRNKLILSPTSASLDGGDSCYRFGQLLGVAIRSQGVLDVDMAALLWKLLSDERLGMLDVASIDYTAYKQLQWRHDSGAQFTKEEFEASVTDSLTWCTTLSDGITRVELIAGGANKSVRFEQREKYARSVLRARLEESRLPVNLIRAGLYSVVPPRACHLLTWHELELRVCGSPQLDLDLLAKHTVYAPRKFTVESEIVKNFWRALRHFTPEEQAKFMQFSWARSRLPPESGKENTWRMKLNILEGAGENDLPTCETCFFNVNIPAYKFSSNYTHITYSINNIFEGIVSTNLFCPFVSVLLVSTFHVSHCRRDYETLYNKLNLAITHCSSINS
jgi:hypothetical protein